MVENKKIMLGDLLEKRIVKKSIAENELVSFIPMEAVTENGVVKENKIIEYKYVKKGLTYFEKSDVLVAKITPCFENGKGACLDNLLTVKGFGSTEFHVLRANRDSISRYVFYYTQLNTFRKRLEREMVGSAGQKRIQLKLIENYELKVKHNKEEQKAIATALSDMDNLILSLEKLISKKKLIKEGAMEELLTGKKRLDEFNDNWSEKPLGDIVNIRKGQMITEELAVKGTIPVIAGGKKPAYYHNKANRFGNTITVSASGANAGYISYYVEPIYASDCSTIEEGNGYSIQFIYQQLKLRQSEIYKMQTGGAQPHIHPSDLEPIIFTIPNTCEEQEAIATVLSDMDNEIEKLEKKLDKYKNIKSGMMEELLTGKRRLV